MSATSPSVRLDSAADRGWLNTRDWDLKYISLSVVLVVTPYLLYLGFLEMESLLKPLGQLLNADIDSISRNLVNAIVALLVGGPHMYATFSRTALDHDFREKFPALIWSSLLIPVVVVTLALVNLPLLLTVFFFWASIHVLHQIIFITELYNNKHTSTLSAYSRFTDYAVILTCLYPLAAWKISTGNFRIGPNDISGVVAEIIGKVGLKPGPWMVWMAGGAFGLALAMWIIKSVQEYQQGSLHLPKTVFIALTVTVSFFVPALGNLDTAFQGMNVWHSLQYLALTWMLNNLRQHRGELGNSPFVERLSTDNSARRYYMFNVGLTIADIFLAGVIFVVLYFVLGQPFDFAFDRSYYIAVLSFLWMHYYHDHFLFAQPGVIKA